MQWPYGPPWKSAAFLLKTIQSSVWLSTSNPNSCATWLDSLSARLCLAVRRQEHRKRSHQGNHLRVQRSCGGAAADLRLWMAQCVDSRRDRLRTQTAECPVRRRHHRMSPGTRVVTKTRQQCRRGVRVSDSRQRPAGRRTHSRILVVQQCKQHSGPSPIPRWAGPDCLLRCIACEPGPHGRPPLRLLV